MTKNLHIFSIPAEMIESIKRGNVPSYNDLEDAVESNEVDTRCD